MLTTSFFRPISFFLILTFFLVTSTQGGEGELPEIRQQLKELFHGESPSSATDLTSGKDLKKIDVDLEKEKKEKGKNKQSLSYRLPNTLIMLSGFKDRRSWHQKEYYGLFVGIEWTMLDGQRHGPRLGHQYTAYGKSLQLQWAWRPILLSWHSTHLLSEILLGADHFEKSWGMRAGIGVGISQSWTSWGSTYVMASYHRTEGGRLRENNHILFTAGIGIGW